MSLKYLLCLGLCLSAGCGGTAIDPVDPQPDPPAPACDGTPMGDRCLRVLANEHAQRLLVRGSFLYSPRTTSDMGTPLLRIPLEGGEPVKLVDTERAVEVVADDTSLYWCRVSVSGAANGGLMRAPLGGGDAVELVAPLPTPQQVVVDASSLYWTDSEQGTLSKVPKTGGQPVTLASGLHPIAPVVFDDHVYYIDWTTPSSVARVPTAGGASETLATETSSAASGLAVHKTGVYWVNSLDGTLSRAPHGGQREVLAKWQGADANVGGTVRVDDDAVYWAVDGVLRKLPHGSSSPEIVAEDDFNEGFVIDETSIYWSSPDREQIVRLSPK